MLSGVWRFFWSLGDRSENGCGRGGVVTSIRRMPTQNFAEGASPTLQSSQVETHCCIGSRGNQCFMGLQRRGRGR